MIIGFGKKKNFYFKVVSIVNCQEEDDDDEKRKHEE